MPSQKTAAIIPMINSGDANIFILAPLTLYVRRSEKILKWYFGENNVDMIRRINAFLDIPAENPHSFKKYVSGSPAIRVIR
ncbi:hypothetical protein RvVAT039_pl03020 (plasmid) [Agrobacterium vitis]|nr:hypothetical protein RvVAT039_pl03020 [Agrobacterium vitis]